MIEPGDVATASLFLMMTAMGMGLRAHDFVRVVRQPSAVVFGSVAQMVLLPLAAFAVARALALDPAHAIGLVLIAACPGGATSNAFSRFAHGDVALSVSLTAISSSVSFVTVPLVVGLATASFAGAAERIDLSFADTAGQLVWMTALPLAGGMAVLRWAPRLAVRVRGTLLGVTTAVVVVMVAVLGLSLSGKDLLRLLATVGPAVATLLALMAGIALLGGSALGLPRAQRRTILIEVAIQNFNLALVLALTVLRSPVYLGPALVYLPVMLVVALAAMVVARLRDAGGARR